MGIHFSDTGMAERVRIEALSHIGHLAGVEQSFHFWHGASGRRFIHTAHELIECPQLPACNYVLVRRLDDGSRIVMRVGKVEHEAPSLNLAHIRQRAARLGANEVHVHLLAETPAARARIESDLQAGQFAELVSEPTSARPERLC